MAILAGLAGAAHATPILSESPTSLSYGDVLVGSSKSLNEKISNTGANSTLTGTESLTGTAGGQFSGPSPVTLDLVTKSASSPASSTSSYKFAPTSVGTDTGSLGLSTNGGSGTVTLAGTGVAPIEKTTDVTVPVTLVGKTGTGTLIVTNTGDGNLSGAGASSNLHGSVTSVSAAPFGIAGGAINLADGKSASYSYGFDPTVIGTTSTTVPITFTNGSSAGTNAAQTLNFSIAGEAVAPVEQTTVVNTPYTLVGTTTSGSVKVTNIGDGNLAGADSAANPTNLHGTVTGTASGPFTASGGTVDLRDSANSSFGYSFAPTVRGAASASVTASFSNGNSNGTNTAQTLGLTIAGQGVAPVNQVTETDAGPTRIGTTSTAAITVDNVGDGNLSGLGAISNLNGSVGALSGTISGAGGTVSETDGSSTTFSYKFAPTTAGTVDSAPVAVNFTNGNTAGTNAPQSSDVTLSGVGTGPSFKSSEMNGTPDPSDPPSVPAFSTYSGKTINFGTVRPGGVKELGFSISNATDGDYDAQLDGLSILGGNFSGPGASAFKLADPIDEVLAAGDREVIDLLFAPTSDGRFEAMFNLVSDEDAAFGTPGDVFSLRVYGHAAVPEPGSLGLLGGALAAFAARRRKKA